MTADTPSPLEPTWFVEGIYGPDAAEARAPFRTAHLARLRDLIASGSVVTAGSFPDMSGSVMIVRAASAQEALDLFREDPYLRNGVWVQLRARPFLTVRDRV